MIELMPEPIRILVVEDRATDYELARREIRKVLPACEFALVTARKEFLTALESFQPHVVLSDYDLPRFDGMTALSLTREHAPLTPFIIWTGSRTEDVAVECMKAGANNYVIKDNLKRLGPAVLHAIEERRLMVGRQEAAQDLAGSERRFRKLIENSSDVIVIIGADAKIRYVGESVYRNYGYQPEEVMGVALLEFIHPDDQAHAAARLAEVLQNTGGGVPAVFRTRHKDGSWRWTEVTARNVLDDPDVQGILINYRDVTERTHAEDKYRSIFENSPVGIYQSTMEGRFLTVNPAFARMLGYQTPGQMVAEITDIACQVYSDSADRQGFMQALAENRQVTNLVYRMKCREKGVLWVTESARAVEDANGETLYYEGMVEDVTERKRVEEGLSRATHEFQELIQASPAGIITYDREGRVKSWNPAASRITGYTEEEVLGQRGLHLLADELPEFDAIRQQMLLGETISGYELERHRKDGRSIFLYMNAAPTRDSSGELNGFMAILEDITDSRMAREALGAAERKYRSLVEQLPVAIYTDYGDATGTKAYISPQFEKITGYPVQDWLENPDFWPAVIHPKDRERVLQENARTNETGEPFNAEYRMLKPDGSSVWVREQAILIGEHKGTPGTWRGVLHDISDRKRAELESRALLEIMRGQAVTRDLDEFLKLIHHAIDEVIYAENFFVVLHNEATGLFEEIYSVDQYDPPMPPGLLERSLSAYVFRTGEPLLLGSEEFRQLAARGEVQLIGTDSASWLGAPLIAAGKVIGIMAVQDYLSRDRYSPHDREFMSSIATQVALAIERKRADQELQGSRRVLAQAEALTHLGAWDADLLMGQNSDANVLRWSDEVYRILGYEPGTVQPSEGFFRDHIIPEDRPRVAAAASAAVVQESTYDVEFQIVRSDGIRRVVHERAETMPGGNGHPLRMIGAIQDITERRQAEAVTRRHVAEMEALYENGLALSSLLDPAEIGTRLIQTFENHLSWHHVAIRLRPPGTDELHTVACNQPGLNDEARADLLQRFNSMVGRVGQGLSGWVAQTGQPLTAPDVYAFPQYVETFPSIRSGLYVPLKVGDDVIGCISVESEEPAAFDGEDERLLGTLGNQAAIAFENARLYRDIRRQNSILVALQQATLPLLGQRALSDVLETIINQASQLLAASTGYMYLVDADADQMYVAVGTGIFAAVVGSRIGRGEGLAGKVWESLQPLKVDDYHTWAGRSPLYETIDFHAVVGVPLMSDGSLRGVLGLAHTAADVRFSQDDVEVLDRFAQLAAIAYENARLSETAQRELEQRYRTEAALRSSEAQYRHLFEHMLNGFAYCQMITEEGQPDDFIYVRVNDAFHALTGLEDVVGRRATDVIPGIKEQTPEILEVYNRVATTGWPERFEIDFTPLGIWLDVAVYSPEVGYFVALFDDITARKRSEAALRERLALMDYSAGHTLAELLQKSLDDLGELIASPIGFFHFVDGEQQNVTPQAWSSRTLEVCLDQELKSHSLAAQAGFWADVLRTRRPVVLNDYLDLLQTHALLDGHTPLSRLMVMPVFRNDTVVALIGMGNKPSEYTGGDVEVAARFADYAWDITERKRMEISLADERNLLAERVEERTSQLTFANAELARAGRLKDEFLATMSHELRTPLNAILSLSESLQEGIYGPLTPEQSCTLRTVEESGHHLLELINDILDVSKIEAGKISLQIQPLEITRICESALRLVRQQAISKGLSLSFTQDNAAGEVLADNRRLKQMLVNLLSNAVKFTPDGGHVGLEVTSEAEGEILRFTVSDDGPGIAPQQLPLLFQPFVQLDSSLSRRYAGSGLGLSLVRRLAELQGGGAGVETELGKGSHFFFALPAAPSDKQSVRNEAVWEQVPGPHDLDSRAACLLICDDHPVNLKAASDYLRAFGFRIVTAANGFEALDRATECGPDLVLMDIQMPEMDGLEATRRIRATPALAGVPIIAITALAMPGDRERCLEAGANEFMPKPLSLRVLRAKIQELLEKS